jgi:uncharacterized membrane protein YeaQ/YmgE (transglycosylase-associated protein family)
VWLRWALVIHGRATADATGDEDARRSVATSPHPSSGRQPEGMVPSTVGASIGAMTRQVQGVAMHDHRQRLASVSVVAAVIGSFVVTLAAPQVDAAPRPKASVEVADTAALAPDGQSVSIDITASCARGWQVLEAFVTISQPQTSGTAGIPLSCSGRAQTFAVTVPSLGAAFEPGDAQASAFVLIERRGRTQQAQDSETILLV